MTTKQCGKCKQVKPISEFYRHCRDGYQSMCKECKRGFARIYNRTPKRREYNKQFYDKLKEQGYYKDYSQRPDVKKRQAEHMKQYAQDPKYRARFQARWYARRMTEKGIIEQQPCALCGEDDSQRHHPNYDQPLYIVWVCVQCHRKLHIKMKAEVKDER